ncbi:MAG: anthranilate phosphoribosyltransferase [Verrucomicrobiota bacterium]
MDVLIHHLEAQQELSPDEVATAAHYLLDAAIPDEKKARLLEALSTKGETPGEIAGFVEAFLGHAVDPQLSLLDRDGPTLDVCGTGGDKLDLFNVSTTAMFIAAAAGAVVVKHGNRGITSQSGGADVLEALGIRIDLPVEGFRRSLEQAGVGFMFAPLYHPAFQAVAGVRKALAAKGVRTLFNLIGPLLNPARPQCQLVGVCTPGWCSVFAEILERLGRRCAWVVYGTTDDARSVDEVSLMGTTRICKSGSFRDLVGQDVRPNDFGLQLAQVESLRGGNAQTNAAILEAILSGRDTGPKRDMVLLNAGAALACAGLAPHIHDGIDIAREMITCGAAMERLRLMRKASQ